MKQQVAYLCSLVAVLLFVQACTASTWGEGPPSARDLPIYEGAADVRSTHPDSTLQLTSYQTTATPEDIFSFYRDRLLSEGWKLNPDLSNASRLNFSWKPDTGTGTYDELTVSTQAHAGGQTHVDLKLVTEWAE